MALNPGSIAFQSNLTYTVAAGGAVLASYAVPGTFNTPLAYATGTGPNQANAFALIGGSAAATPASTDLTSVTRVDGVAGFTHVREVIIFNLDGTNILKYDPTVVNGFLAGMETAAKIDIQPGAPHRFSKPLGTTGWTVSSTNKIISLDPGANTISWQGIIIGD